MLTQAQLKELLHYNPDTGVFTWLVARAGKKIGNIAGSYYKTRYLRIRIFKKIYQAHRLAWLYIHGEHPLKFIDHINGIGTDNRISNIRECTNAENQQNQRKAHKDSKTGYLGVYFNKKYQKYMVQISINGKQKTVGLFPDIEVAHQYYLTVKREFHPFNIL